MEKYRIEKEWISRYQKHGMVDVGLSGLWHGVDFLIDIDVSEEHYNSSALKDGGSMLLRVPVSPYVITIQKSNIAISTAARTQYYRF